MLASFNFLRDKFNTFYIITCILAFVVVVLRCLLVPFAHDEVATFYYYIQSEKFLPFLSHVDANGHFLNSFLSWIAFKLFGSSAFVLRLPCLLAFLVLCVAVFKLNKSLQSTLAKFILTSFFILSFNILNFYSLCRGYGLSMSFLLLALVYFFDHLKYHSFSLLVKFVLFSQIALSANLTLVFTLLFTAGIIILIQLKNKQFFDLKNILLLLIHFALVYFWVKYAFYLQKNGALYYGGGHETYWKVTFVSLIETIAVKNLLVNVIFILMFAFLLVFWVIQFAKNKLRFLLESNFAICFLLLSSLIAAFYFLKLFFGVNYPEDRTGLFFYILFALSIIFLINEYYSTFNKVFLFIPAFFILHLILNFNISKHQWGYYETMPPEFFEILRSEQKKSPTQITIGGHRVLELFYSFYNYNSTEKLNHMLPPEQMHMNCDYYVTWKKDKPYYGNYYTELAQSKYWNMVLLKRKEPIVRELIYQSTSPREFNSADEFNSMYEKLDTLITSENPILAEFNISVIKTPKPFSAFLVLQVDSMYKSSAYFRRTPLNWIKYDWNGTESFTTYVQTDNMPLTKCRITAFLWNIDKAEVNFKINSLKLYSLKASGITEFSKALN